MPKLPNQPVVMIRARVQMTHPDRIQFKPYDTQLTFDEPLYVEVPVPQSEVTRIKEGGYVLTLAGWTAFLSAYAEAVEQMHSQYQNRFR